MTDTPKTYQRLTVNLTGRSIAALELAAGLTGDSKTDTVNRALQLYSYVMYETQSQGSELLLREAGGTTSTLKFL